MTHKKIILLFILILLLALMWYFDIFNYIRIERINELSDWINNFGWLAPAIFILLYILATVLFLPGTPLTLLAGLIFGPFLGTVFVSIASTTGATLAFIIGRYIGRSYIEDKFGSNPLFKKLDQGVKVQGWKMVAITRLVPLFPFNAQNYIYGLTDINLTTYTLVSWLCMLPATFAYVSLAGAIIAGQGDTAKTITYIGIAVAVIILLSMISRYIMKKQHIEKE